MGEIAILGGTGFVGRHLCARLTTAGYACRVLSRRPERHRALKVLPRLRLVAVDPFAPDRLAQALEGCDTVINLVGILNPVAQGFRQVHVELVERLVETASQAGVRRLLHMSALNASAAEGGSAYLRTKGEGENLAHVRGHARMAVTSFRPSVIFGPGDGLFNRFAGLLRWAPGILPLACPEARFQPVYVGDVAEAMVRALSLRETWDRRLDLCGPRVYSLRELVAYTADLLGRRVHILGLGPAASRWQARILGMLPGAPFTLDNYLSMQTPSVCGNNDLALLGIRPQAVEAVVPLYLRRGQAAAKL